jgi:cytochrome c5
MNPRFNVDISPEDERKENMEKQSASFMRATTFLSVMVVFLAGVLGCTESSQQASDDSATATRIAPVGKVNIGEPKNTPKPDATAQTESETSDPTAMGATETGKGKRPEFVLFAQKGDGASTEKGKVIYEGACRMCHDTGAAGAPRVGDKEAWAARIGQGMDTLVSHAINGFQGSTGMMPPKGGNTAIPDEDIRSAVAYMVGASQ